LAGDPDFQNSSLEEEDVNEGIASPVWEKLPYQRKRTLGSLLL
jgi:hypothetical protein